MSDKPEGIKSPYVRKKTVLVAKTSNEIVEDMVQGFSATLGALEQVGQEPVASTLTTYLAGFTSALKALDFEPEDAMKLTRLVAERIVEIGNSPNCRKA